MIVKLLWRAFGIFWQLPAWVGLAHAQTVAAPSQLASSAAATQTKPQLPENLTTLPTASGLPVIARVGVYMVELNEINDVENAFSAVVDVRLVWED